jgi:myo-inositol-1(or 4)-monophosphatase
MDDAGDVGHADRERLRAVAAEAATAGGEYLADAFRDGPVEGTYDATDVKAVADREAEERVRSVVTDAFPRHGWYAEESGRASGSGSGAAYEWVVDPLDGTNNFAAGIPLFATAVAVRRGPETLAAAVHEPVTDTVYEATRGGGATGNGEALSTGTGRGLDVGTVSVVVGRDAVGDREARAWADRLDGAIDERCKRTIHTWAPTLDWAALARGGIDAVVALRPDAFERAPGDLLAREAGAVVDDRGDTYVAADDEATLATLSALVEETR